VMWTFESNEMTEIIYEINTKIHKSTSVRVEHRLKYKKKMTYEPDRKRVNERTKIK